MIFQPIFPATPWSRQGLCVAAGNRYVQMVCLDFTVLSADFIPSEPILFLQNS